MKNQKSPDASVPRRYIGALRREEGRGNTSSATPLGLLKARLKASHYIICFLFSVLCLLLLVSAKGGCWNQENEENLTAGSSGVNNLWLPMADSNAPSAAAHFSMVWTGREMLVWGGTTESGYHSSNGAKYHVPPAAENEPWSVMTISLGDWASIDQASALSGRGYHTAVWTGTMAEGGTNEMLIWGGFDADNFLASGARYNPTLNTWNMITSANAPTARAGHTAVWTGAGAEPWRNQMLIWGGDMSGPLNTGGRYRPAINFWDEISKTGGQGMPPARAYHTAVWTGTEMIIWGGSDGSTVLKSGALYDASTNTWKLTGTTDAPSARAYHTAVWSTTTNEMIIWGGQNANGTALNTGSKYNPTTIPPLWTAITATGIAARWGHTTIWTGTEMIIWGGTDDQGKYLNSGAAYNPSTDSWRAINLTGAPSGRTYHHAIWTGTVAAGGTSEMIIWGGWDGTKCLNTGGRYKP